MSKKPQSKKEKHSVLKVTNTVAISILVLSFLAILFRSIILHDWSNFFSLLLDYLFIGLAVMLCINIHEFGHFVLGKFLGYQLVSYRILFLTWTKVNGEIKFSVRENKGFGGACAMMPPDNNLPGWKHGLYYAGGMIFNILSALIFIIPNAILQHPFGLTSSFSRSFILISLLLGAFNLLPLTAGGRPSDGKMVWGFLLKKPYAEKYLGNNKIVNQLSKGSRPNSIQMPAAVNTEKPDKHDMTLLLHRYFQALDSDDETEAIDYANSFEKNLRAFPWHLRTAVNYELCFIGCITEDKTKAELYYNKARKTLEKDTDADGLRVKAYYEYYVNHNSTAALQLCESVADVCDKCPMEGQAMMEKDLAEKLKNIISAEA